MPLMSYGFNALMHAFRRKFIRYRYLCGRRTGRLSAFPRADQHPRNQLKRAVCARYQV